MKKYSFTVLSTILMMFLTSGAFATNGMRLIGFGPVQRAMGGVGVGASLDGAATITNPAGMAYLGGRIDFGATYFDAAVTLKTAGGDIDSDKGASPIPALGLIIPTAIKDLTFGIGAFGVSGIGVDFNLSASNQIMYSAYSLMRFTPSVAYKVIDMVSVGFSANMSYATTELSMNTPGGQMVNMGASAFGGGFVFGVTVKPIKMITVGLVYESPTWFPKFKFNQFLDAPSPAPPVINEFTMTMNQPMNITIGVSAEPIKGLIVAFDFQWINWSATLGNNKPEYTGGSMDMDWSDQLVYKFGVQYTPIQLITVRAGFNYGKSPVPSSGKDGGQYVANTVFPGITEYHITAGIGLNLSEKISVDLGAMFAPEAEIAVAPFGKVTMLQYSLDAGVSYKF